jgi:hypothetical protein
MLETIAITSMFMSLSTDYRKNSYLANVISNESHYVEEIYQGIQKNYFDNFLCFDNINIIKNKIFQLHNLKEISADVHNNAYNLLINLPEFILDKIDIENIYTSRYGTVMIDFEFFESNIFSLEIGKKSIGYFSEIDSSTFLFCDELKTIDKDGNFISSNVLSNDIERFLSKLNIV